MRVKPEGGWLHERGGNAAVMFALTLPVLVGAVGAALDYSRMTAVVASLQKAADAAALAASRELSTANIADDDRFQSVARSVVNASMGLPEADRTFAVAATPTSKRNGFVVTVSQVFKPSGLGSMLMGERTLAAAATAQRKGAGKMCVLALSLKDASESGVLQLEGSSQIVGQDCGVFSNSGNMSGVIMKDTTAISGSLLCSAGGIAREPNARINGEQLTDCPKIPDPLADRPSPAPGACAHRDKSGKGVKLVIEKSRDLPAGTYCEGIEIKGRGTVVTLRADGSNDVLIIKDGQLKVSEDAKLYGRGVGIAFSGASANFEFTGTSTVDLHAPASGLMAGILFYGSPQAPDWLEYKITSGNARVLVGTIYLPKGFFIVDAKNPVADESAYTAVIVNKMSLKDSPKLTLNTNYFQTNVPVAKGISSFGGSINLTH